MTMQLIQHLAVICIIYLGHSLQSVDCYPNGVPVDPKICDMRVDHDPGSNDDTLMENKFDVLLVDGNNQIVNCFQKQKEYKIRIKATTHIRGYLMGVEKNKTSHRKKDDSIPNGSRQLEDICANQILFSHSAKNDSDTIEFKFKLLADEILFRTTVVFSYYKYIVDQRTTFQSCQSTPPPSPSPSPSPSPPPTCESCSNISGITCPHYVTKQIHIRPNEIIDGIAYNCTSLKYLRYFDYSEKCNVKRPCGMGSSCIYQQQFEVTCSLVTWTRSRPYRCIPVNNASTAPVLNEKKLPVVIQRRVECTSKLVTHTQLS